MAIIEVLYTGALRLGAACLPLLGGGESKLARGIRGREGALARFGDWAARERDPNRPLVLFHAPSVGEGFQARAVMAELRELAPDIQLAYTYFSPSAEGFAAASPADVADYLPLDLPRQVAELFDTLRPDAVVFSKTEVWPNLTRVAERRGIPLLLLSATLPEGSSRLRGPARRLLAPAHRRLHRVGAISAEDARRFQQLGVAPDRVVVSGDARFDQVADRAAATDPASPLLQRLADPRPTLIAGSTWAEDEEPLVTAFTTLLAAGADARLVLVPHEPTPEHLSRLEARLTSHRITPRRLSEVTEPDPTTSVIVVDRVGVLGELYALADVAFVGGGFGRRGLHSVLEPAAFGAPVLFGPHHGNAREAGELASRGGGVVVDDAATLEQSLRRLLLDQAARARAGAIARGYVEEGRGAARRGAELVLEALRVSRAP